MTALSPVQPVLSAVLMDESKTTMLRQLFAELYRFYLLVSTTTPANWERYRSFFPSTSEAQRRRDEAQNAKGERRLQDESSY